MIFWELSKILLFIIRSQLPGAWICVQYLLNSAVCLFVIVEWILRANGVMSPNHLRDCRRHPSAFLQDHTLRERVMFQSFPPEHTPPNPSVSVPPTHQIMLNKKGHAAVCQGQSNSYDLLWCLWWVRHISMAFPVWSRAWYQVKPKPSVNRHRCLAITNAMQMWQLTCVICLQLIAKLNTWWEQQHSPRTTRCCGLLQTLLTSILKCFMRRM